MGTGDRGGRSGRGVRGVPHDDPGLQPQRTALAWQRTVLGAAATAAVCALAWARLGVGMPAAVSVGVVAVPAAVGLARGLPSTRTSPGPWMSALVLSVACLSLLGAGASVMGALR